MNHETYMQRCIELAKIAIGNTYPNPLVGSVIVHNGEIIGEGYHHQAGQPHAEIMAIESVSDKNLLSESTIYVSLEPCAHFGKTPPCANRIVSEGFKKVIIGAMDTHDKVNGKGKQILENAGIEVINGILEKECRELNKRFFTFQEKKRPYIILKWAQSNDGFMDENFQPTAISNALINQFMHQLRSQEHAILVGTQTALRDNPSLTTRNISGRNPIRIVIDLDLKITNTSKIFNQESKTIIFNSKIEETQDHLQFIRISRENLLNEMLEKLHQLSIQSVIIEGGAFTLQQFIDQNIWDESYVIENKKLILSNGTKAPKLNQKSNETADFRGENIHYFKNVNP